MTDLLSAVGIDSARVDSFFENKGDVSGWGQGEADHFFGGLNILAAVLAMPADAERREWNQTRAMYRDMEQRISEEVGLPYTSTSKERGVWDLVQSYFDIRETVGTAEADAMMASFPQIQIALDRRDAYLKANPMLFKYYGSMNTLTGFYEGVARDTMIKKYGEDIYSLSAQYTDISNRLALAKALYKGNPSEENKAQLDQLKKEVSAFEKENLSDIKAFREERNYWTQQVNLAAVQAAEALPEKPPLNIRKDLSSETQTQLAQQFTATGPSAQEIASQMSPELQQIVSLYAQGQEMPYAARTQLERLANSYQLTLDELLQLLLQQ